MLTDKLIMAAAGGGGGASYVEDVFSTYLYKGDGTARTITNDINLSGGGGMVWIKTRDLTEDHQIYDTERGPNLGLSSNITDTENTNTSRVTGFNSDGFDLGTNSKVNRSGDNFVSWTFRKAPGFFDVVTYTGDGVYLRSIPHNLGSAPGMIWVKRLDSSQPWAVYHRSEGAGEYGVLNSTTAFQSDIGYWASVTPTSTDFRVGVSNSVNLNGATYVAYLFAHDDARFGPNGDESIISCGTYTGNASSSGPVIDLGWEPQWLLIKRSNAANSWLVFDTARGIAYGGDDNFVYADSDVGDVNNGYVNVLATGFEITDVASLVNASGSTYIYMAIRRPDKAPETVSDFFQLRTRTGTGVEFNSSVDFNVDMGLVKRRDSTNGWVLSTREFPDGNYVRTNSTSGLNAGGLRLDVRSEVDSTVELGTQGDTNNSGSTYVDYFWKRARGAFDVVLYQGSGGSRTVTHGLGAAPDMIWIKNLTNARNWAIYCSGFSSPQRQYVSFTTTAVTFDTSIWNDTLATSTEFSLGSSTEANRSGDSFVACLFASVPGIVDIGSYTGTGASGLQIDCGFTAGARLVFIKRTEGAGSWEVFDTARGINASADDPNLELDSDNAEVTTNDYLEPYSAGFELNTGSTAVNKSGGEYIYMAIA